jgi:Ser/Thr protein kinase RdoA (MazF antagonist)
LHPLSTDQASLIVELLATLHATFWDRLPPDRRGPLGWLYTPSGDVTSLLTGALMNTSMKRLAERTTIPVDFPVDRGRFIADSYRAVATLIDTPPHKVMHGDAHPGNVYFRDDECGTSGLAGGVARTPIPRTGLYLDHQHDARGPPCNSTRPT